MEIPAIHGWCHYWWCDEMYGGIHGCSCHAWVECNTAHIVLTSVAARLFLMVRLARGKVAKLTFLNGGSSWVEREKSCRKIEPLHPKTGPPMMAVNS